MAFRLWTIAYSDASEAAQPQTQSLGNIHRVSNTYRVPDVYLTRTDPQTGGYRKSPGRDAHFGHSHSLIGEAREMTKGP